MSSRCIDDRRPLRAPPLVFVVSVAKKPACCSATKHAAGRIRQPQTAIRSHQGALRLRSRVNTLGHCGEKIATLASLPLTVDVGDAGTGIQVLCA
jgi:hypothetical protein